jgi:hypothetical protein
MLIPSTPTAIKGHSTGERERIHTHFPFLVRTRSTSIVGEINDSLRTLRPNNSHMPFLVIAAQDNRSRAVAFLRPVANAFGRRTALYDAFVLEILWTER